MDALRDALEGLFSATLVAGGTFAEASARALESVDWKQKPIHSPGCSEPVVDDYLERLCHQAGQYGSNAHIVAQAVLEARGDLKWCRAFEDWEDPDIQVFTQRFAWCSVIGSHAPIVSDKVEAGFSIQGVDILYPAHAHQAEEFYWIIGGGADWKIGSDPWFAVRAGDTIHHESGHRHAMHTNQDPLLAFWLWTSHLDSPLVVVRG